MAKILLIDDNIPVSDAIELLLEKNGYECKSFNEPGQAIEAYRSDTFDIVLTDYDMPGVNGIELAERIREIDTGAFIILMTGEDIDHLQKLYDCRHINACVRKTNLALNLEKILSRR